MPPGTPFTIFKEKKKPKDKNGPEEELALVKAAAWAWYQHGSGAEGKAMAEFDATRSRRAPRPSRYKQEAMKWLLMDQKETIQALESKSHEGILLLSQAPSPIHRTSSSLLDNYEIRSISKQLDHLIESTGVEFGEKLCADDVLERQESSSSNSSRSTVSPSSMMKKKKKSKKLMMMVKGFWIRPRLGLGCHSRDDVAAGALVGDGLRRWPQGHVPVVNVVCSRPRLAHA